MAHVIAWFFAGPTTNAPTVHTKGVNLESWAAIVVPLVIAGITGLCTGFFLLARYIVRQLKEPTDQLREDFHESSGQLVECLGKITDRLDKHDVDIQGLKEEQAYMRGLRGREEEKAAAGNGGD